MEKKTASAIMLTLLLTSMLTLAFNIQPVKAEGTIYIRGDGSVDPPTAPISTVDNITYTFNGNINDSIVVERDGVVVDGAGYTVEGTGGGYGIDLSFRCNVTIRNTQVKAFQYGIQLANSSDCNISGNNITNNSLKGVSLYNSANNTFRNNIVDGSMANFEVEGDHMLAFFQDVDGSNMLDGKPLRYLVNQENATIDNSTYSSIGYLALINSTNLVIEELKLENNTQGMLLAYTRNSQVISNNIRNNAIYGIKLVECTNITISGNNIVNNGLVASSSWWTRYGVCFESSNNNFLFGNNMSRNYSSVWLNSSSNNIILENDMTDSQHITGVRLGNSSFNTIQGNNLTNFVTIFIAFFVDSSSSNNISENKITAGITGIGFILRDSSYNNISENDMNQIRGFDLKTSNSNIILGNKVIAPDDDVYAFGIFLGDSSSNNRIIENSMEAKNGTNVWLSNSTGNMLFHNNFMACMRQAYDYSWDNQAIPPSVNVWDDGYPSGGNYWSDYIDVDIYHGPNQNETGSDGIGDTPYNIDVDNRDNYPLMKPFPWDQHDIAVMSMSVSKNVCGQGYKARVSVMVFNYGENTEILNLTAYLNDTIPVEMVSLELAGRTPVAVDFTWNTTGFAYGNYSMSAYATPVENETYTADNTLVDGWVFVTIPGDVNGDKKVNILDCILISNHFGHVDGNGHTHGSKEWLDCVNCDINSDSKTNVLDCIVLSNNFGQSWT